MFRILKILFLIALILPGCSGDQLADIPGVLVSTEWLSSHMKDPSLVILHTGEKESYDTAHIPMARFIPARELMVDNDSLRHEIPPIERIDSVLSSTGINNDSRIILCYENERGLLFASRVFLTLDYAGIGVRTHVLNGGLEKWKEDGFPVTDSICNFPEGEFDLEVDSTVLVDAEDLLPLLDNRGYVILDARPPSYYRGRFDSAENRVVGGHIEGAVNLPYDYFLSESNPVTFKENRELINEFRKVGMDDSKAAVLYCGTGILASVDYLVSVHLGYPALFFDGSFEEWEKRGLPVIKPVQEKRVKDEMEKDNRE